jgi:hypothetical protein
MPLVGDQTAALANVVFNLRIDVGIIIVVKKAN